MLLFPLFPIPSFPFLLFPTLQRLLPNPSAYSLETLVRTGSSTAGIPVYSYNGPFQGAQGPGQGHAPGPYRNNGNGNGNGNYGTAATSNPYSNMTSSHNNTHSFSSSSSSSSSGSGEMSLLAKLTEAQKVGHKRPCSDVPQAPAYAPDPARPPPSSAIDEATQLRVEQSRQAARERKAANERMREQQVIDLTRARTVV